VDFCAIIIPDLRSLMTPSGYRGFVKADKNLILSAVDTNELWG
jgi:hypothetical protein